MEGKREGRELSSMADIVTLGLFLCQAATLLRLCTLLL